MTGKLVPAGVVRKAHGTDGAFLVVSEIFPAGFRAGDCPVYIEVSGESRRALDPVSIRPVLNGVLVRCRTIDRREDAEALTGAVVWVPEDCLEPLDEGSWYTHQIIGLRVETVSGAPVGVVESVMKTGANDVYVVRSGTGAEELIPAIRSVVKSIDPDAGLMRIDPLEGMLAGDDHAV